MPCSKGTFLLSLITLLQIPFSSANPVPHGSEAHAEPVRVANEPRLFDAAVVADASVVSTAFPVVEIQDGQIQVLTESASASTTLTAESPGFRGHAPVRQPLPTDVIPITSSSSQVVESSLVAILSSTAEAASSPAASPMITITPVTSIVPDTLLTSLTTSAIQSPTQPVATNTIGSLHTSLEASGLVSTQPFPTSIATATAPLSLISSIFASPTLSINATSINVDDIFQSIAVDAPPSQISQRGDHPVPRLNIVPQQQKLETNKFYANLFLGTQSSSVFTFPYALNWIDGQGQGDIISWGLSIAHSERSQLVYGPAGEYAGAPSYYVNPIGIESVILSAAQLTNGTTLTTDTLRGFSVNANLLAPGASSATITFPLVQGMAFVTALYNDATPIIDSGVGIKNITYSGSVSNSTAYKYRLLLSDSTTWLVYVFPSAATYPVNMFTLLSANRVQGSSGFSGYIQVAKLPTNAISSASSEAVYDAAAGAYPTAATIAGSVAGTAGTYSLTWTKGGDTNKTLLMFALPHHVSSFSTITSPFVTGIQLVTTTKGYALAVAADSWTLVESELPISMTFAPWSATSQQSLVDVSAEAQDLINQAATTELAEDIDAQTDLDSMYYSGKALAKFAAIVYAVHDMADNATLALTGLQKLEAAYATFVNNQQIYPLVYDTSWGGAVSSSTYINGNSGDDFGNTYYNDHHFHYGYFVYTAAVIAYLDPAWLNSTNQAWVDMLVRDYANPVETDPYYPFSRSFDWYHGHSWAAGLFESADGKNQESSSEDTMASYGVKMWGKITGDTAMEARGNLMLSIQARSLADYYLYTTDNTVEPASFIPNKAGGIVFENKIDHTTYFGTNIEYIEGIQMIPIMPFSTLTRRQAFVTQEWDTYFTTYVSSVTSAWRGILMANLAIIDPTTSFNFFANTTGDFLPAMIDGGASQTWYLAYSAALGGSTSVSKRDDTTLETKVSRDDITGSAWTWLRRS